MRALLAALLATTALPALAETIAATSQITAVTIYPDGAQITRQVQFTAPDAGPHELLITDLPQGTEPGQMRLQGADGWLFGAFSLRADRLPPRDTPLSPAQQAAQTAIDSAEAAERDAMAQVELVEAEVQAAEARRGFLTSFSGSLPENATPDSLRAMAVMIGSETLAAAEAAAKARRSLWPAQQALEKAQEARAKAQAAFDALPSRDHDYTALAVALEAPEAGASSVTVTHYIQGASWQPFYDLQLTRQGTPALQIQRSVRVSQSTGEDWTGIDLTLSTARPADQAAPSMLWPDFRAIEKPGVLEPLARNVKSSAMAMDMVAAPMAAAPAPLTAQAALQGDTVVYHYPRAVDIASGVEDLRLSLDQISVQPSITAVAVPRRDRTAFVEASFINPTTEPLLPGAALLFREGVLVGNAQIEMIAAGAEAKIAFGAIDGLRLRRDMPQRDQGQHGVFSTTNQQTETAVLTIENLSQESWPLRVIDQVSYSEQQDLKVTVQAEPSPDVTDLDGQRGILAWDFELPAGQKKLISLGQTLSWPDGMELR